MRTPLGVFVFICILLILDFYFFQAVKTVSQTLQAKYRSVLYILYWGITALVIIGFLVFVYTDHEFLGKKFRTYLFATIMGLFFAKLVGMVFFLVDDLRRGIQWLAGKLFFNHTEVASMPDQGISRSVFLSWLGIAAGSLLFGGLTYGFGNKYNYKVRKIKLRFPNLPSSFLGIKIVHISDIHSGSFLDHHAVQSGVQMIMDQKPDLIFFTGDLVNDKASEMDGFMSTFAQLKAPMGVYSTLGNHDYGDYVKWPQGNLTQEQNLQQVMDVHAKLGWRLLMNENVILEKDGEKIAILGVENWSAKNRFPKHGKMNLAYENTENIPFKILLSHDPSHWDAEVRPDYPDIDLMLSGHTHGMQFGVEIPGFKWSPAQYMYKQWAGLYEEGSQKLYVNRGFGFIGYPGRVGVLPEITVIEFE